MNRLIDDIRAAREIQCPWFVSDTMREKWAAHVAIMRGLLMNHDLPVVLCDHVSRYYFELTGQEYWNLQRDFDNLTPVYQTAWFEHRFPRTIHSDLLGDSKIIGLDGGRSGWLVLTVPRGDVVGDNIPPEAKWIVCASHFVDYGLGEIYGPPALVAIAVDAAGRALETPSLQAFTDGAHDEQVRNLTSWLNPVLLTICMMHRQPVTLSRRAEVEVFHV